MAWKTATDLFQLDAFDFFGFAAVDFIFPWYGRIFVNQYFVFHVRPSCLMDNQVTVRHSELTPALLPHGKILIHYPQLFITAVSCSRQIF